MLSRLRFLQAQGHRVSILDFHPSGEDYEAFDQALAARVGCVVHRDGNTCRTLLEGILYACQILPVAQEELLEVHRPIVRAIMQALQRDGVDYVLTFDENYWALLAAWRLHIRGAHFFSILDAIKRFARNPGYVWFWRQQSTGFLSLPTERAAFQRH